jgi:hypothetical protein
VEIDGVLGKGDEIVRIGGVLEAVHDVKETDGYLLSTLYALKWGKQKLRGSIRTGIIG